MFEKKKKEKQCERKPLKIDGQQIMSIISLESSMEFARLAVELINKYKANNIDVVPISELEKCHAESLRNALGSDSAVQYLLEQMED